MAELIGADDDEIVFVSGATESCNLALRGASRPRTERKQHITLATEHPAVLETVRWLGERGFNATVLPVMENGLLDLTVLAEELSERTLLVSIMLANNEIGVVQPVAEITRMAHEVGAIVHTDATQAVGRISVDVDCLDVDMLSLSGHKIYGPNGIGALYLRSRTVTRLEPVMTGGSQEKGIRPGTVPAPLAVGLGAACELVSKEMDSEARRIGLLTEQLRASLTSQLPTLVEFGHRSCRIPGNLNVGVPGVLAEWIISAVSGEVAISTGAGCSTGSPSPSHVLLGLGVGDELAATATRISLGRFTTEEEVTMSSAILGRAWKAMAGGLV